MDTNIVTDFIFEFGTIKEVYNVKKFNVSKFVVEFCENQSNKIIDGLTVPNLLVLDTYDLLSIILRKKSNIFIQFEANNKEEYLDALYLRIEVTNAILRSLGNMNYLIVSKTTPQSSTEIIRENVQVSSDDFNENVVQLLVKLGILKTSLKLSCEDLPITHIQTEEPTVFFNKDIDNTKCTNCANCITYCPTQAFSYNETKDSILFISGKCIGCNLCETMCEEKAVINNPHINLIDFAFDVSSKKITFTN